jgi:hypothetical protein
MSVTKWMRERENMCNVTLSYEKRDFLVLNLNEREKKRPIESASNTMLEAAYLAKRCA